MDLAFTVGPQTFLQVNTPQTPVLYEKALDAADVQPGDQILDLYCGVGTITLAAARRAGPHGRALGVERVEASIVCARENAARNSIPQAAFVAEPTETFLSAGAQRGASPTASNPPRSSSTRPIKAWPAEPQKALADLFRFQTAPSGSLTCPAIPRALRVTPRNLPPRDLRWKASLP